ncbi:scavenger receptor class B member 1-like [Onthophagus taurus]|uniref:scavenger receptor class B member 1-like n=1 Tax=Onthophagus taurus TaxID=166361 RepID=UPI0039BE186E
MKLSFYLHKNGAKYAMLTSIGGCISILGYLIYILNPLQLILDKLLTFQPGSLIFKLWTQPPYEVLAKIYIFNVTNSEQFLAGKEKLNLTQTGPYVYQEIVHNSEAIFNENGTLTYKPIRELKFRPELSVEDPDKARIIGPNIPLLGISSYMKNEYGLFMNLGFSSVVNMVKSPSLTNLSVTEYLFGYEDPLVELASTYVPSWIDFTKFGILDRLMSIDNGNTITMHLSTNTTSKDDILYQYSVDIFNGSPGLKQWGYREDIPEENSPCNTVEGAFESGVFPRHLKENTTVRLYRKAFCRSTSMIYENTDYTSSGMKYYNYRIDQNFLSTSEENPENKCFCKNSKKCLPKGFGSLDPCYYGIPIAMSQPHYLNADPEIRKQVIGMNPDQEKHDTVMKLSPELGIPIYARLRMQINLNVSPDQIVTSSKPFQGMILPLFWVELGIYDMPSYLGILINIAAQIPTIEMVTSYILGMIGALMIATVGVCVIRGFNQNRSDVESENQGLESSPFLSIPVQPIIRSEFKLLR